MKRRKSEKKITGSIVVISQHRHSSLSPMIAERVSPPSSFACVYIHVCVCVLCLFVDVAHFLPIRGCILFLSAFSCEQKERARRRRRERERERRISRGHQLIHPFPCSFHPSSSSFSFFLPRAFLLALLRLASHTVFSLYLIIFHSLAPSFSSTTSAFTLFLP